MDRPKTQINIEEVSKASKAKSDEIKSAGDKDDGEEEKDDGVKADKSASVTESSEREKFEQQIDALSCQKPSEHKSDGSKRDLLEHTHKEMAKLSPRQNTLRKIDDKISA